MSSNASTMNYPANDSMARLIALENRTGYTMQQFNGQRKYWNPKWKDPIPPRGCEVFVGKIPRDLFEDELVPVFEKVGQLFELRLMMDFSGFNRGYAFVCYTCREHAQLSIEKLDNYEIRPGQRIGVCRSVDNCRLFVGGIPKDKSQQEIKQAMCEISEDVSDVIVYPGIEAGEANRGFAFVEYSTHRAAAMARRKLIPGRITIFGNEVVTDWAEPEVDANDTLSRIKNVYVRNLKITTSHYTIFSAFNAIRPGAIERVKKIEDRDYAFVHFLRREDALYAVQVMNGQIIDGQAVQVSLAKPPSNKRDVKTPIPVRTNQITNTKPPTFPLGQVNSLLISKPDSISPIVNAIPTLSSAAPKHFTSLMTNQPQTLQPVNAKFQQPISNTQPPMLVPGQSALKPVSLTSALSMPNIYQPSTTSVGKQIAPAAPSMNDIVNEFKKMWLMGNNQNGKSNLEPVCTLDHIAKIQCPVVYLDQLCAMFNNGVRPLYKLYCDESFGITRYVYQVTLMNKTYMPPSNMFSTSIAEAQKNSARYILAQLDPWLKLKFLEVVNGNKCGGQLQPESSKVETATTGLIKSLSHADGLDQYALNDVGWKTLNPVVRPAVPNAKPVVGNSESSWKQWIEMNLPPARPAVVTSAVGMSTIPRHSYNSVSVNKDSLTSSSSLGLSDGLWDRLSAPEPNLASVQNGTTRSVAPNTSSLLASALGSSCFSDFKRHSAFDCVATSANF